MVGNVSSQKFSSHRRLGDLGVFAAKLAVTGFCFWYLVRSIDLKLLVRAPQMLDLRWAFLATVLLMVEVPLIGLRWLSIVDALDDERHPQRIAPIIACTAISNFFAQVVPNIAADSLRAWMLTRFGRGWHLAIISVIVDRASGIAALFAIGFLVLQLPSRLAALNGFHAAVTGIFGGILIFGGVLLFLISRCAGVLEAWRYTAWASKVAKAIYGILLQRSAVFGTGCIAFLVHALTIIAVWLLAHACGLQLSFLDAAVVFVVIVAVALIPLSIGGWGIRELTMTSLLAGYGVPLERSLFFSVSFGLALLIAALPGAVVWAVYSPGRVPLRPRSN